MVGHNDRGVKSNGDKLEEELSEVRMEMTKCAIRIEVYLHLPYPPYYLAVHALR